MYRQTIIKGAVILTAANIITRLIGFFYRIYMAKTIGAEGMGLFQLITPLYMLVWSVSSSGLSTTMSKLTAQEKAKGSIGNAKRLLHCSVAAAVGIALCFSLAMYFFSEEIAEYIIKNPKTALSLRIISLCFPFMAAGSVMRGYYLGLQNTSISAISQILEQCVRMAVIYMLASTLIPRGLEYACGAAVWGMAAGEIISFIYVLIYHITRHRHYKHTLSIGRAAIMIGAMAVPLTLNRMTGSLFSTAENLLIPRQLIRFGMSESEAISLLGRLTGMAMPLITFPSSLLTALATATMPAISESYALKNRLRIKSTIHQSLTITAIISVFTTAIFIVYPEELGILIYSQRQIGGMLRMLAVMCPFMYTQVTLSAVLNGLGEQLFIFRTGVFSSLINIAGIVLLIPLYGINAFLYVWILSSIMITFMTLYRVSRILDIRLPLASQYIKPAIASAAACMVSKMCSKHIWQNTEFKYNMICTVAAAFLIYIFMIFQTGCIKKEDLRL